MRSLHKIFNDVTYHSYEIFRRVIETGDLRIPWAYKSAPKWKVDPEEFLAICPTHCPVCDEHLDYGLGDNNHNKKDYNTPSCDHKIAQSVLRDMGLPEKQWNYLGNLQIICNRCNTLKSNATEKDIKRFENITKMLKADNTTLLEDMKNFGKISN